ncbi:SprT-like domain-containing protein [Lysinibacter cavernae]|uniref:Putative SprT family Zn-dependent metalloprotease n=1 Tax=Lysinibacter cavernae TaxID=1640652 RepID=A0A7X5TV08_9MICO|nr:SprT-like domain-containing protein [Lysinibacter cavernae]NIH54232.1 putative SprT family Zn-dependent metalloprotease [Lysinibacter cavernae]
MAELTRVRVWAQALINLHLDSNSWTFDFDNAKRRAGLCDYQKKRITVSRYLAAKYDDDEIHQILLHEIAHALAGHRAGHGQKWKAIADDLGYDGKRLHDGESAHELAPYVGTCPAGHHHYRYRKPTRPLACGLCGRGFRQEHLITWRTQTLDPGERRALQRAARE